MLRFYLPLASMVLLITTTHSVIDAGLARFPNPAPILAGYAVAKSVASLLENPMFMIRQTTVSLVRDKGSYLLVRRAVAILSSLFFALIAAVALVPFVSQVVLGDVMGLSGEAYHQARIGLILMPFLPVVTGWRNFQQGLAILKKGNDLLPLATAFRMGYLIVFMLGVVPLTGWHSAMVGSIGFVGGIGVEMLVMGIGLKFIARRTRSGFLPLRRETTGVKPTKNPAEGQASRSALGWKELGEFFAPLAATTLIITGTLPLINAALARGERPEVTLAAFAVALSIGQTLSNPINMLHQCALTFVDENDPSSLVRVRRFVAGTGLFFAGVITTVGFSAVGPWLFSRVIGLSPEITPLAVECFRFFALIALASAAREYVWGLLMRRRETGKIGGAKALTTLVMAIMLYLGLHFVPGSMAIVAAAGLAVGAIVEAVFLAWKIRDRQSSHPQVTAGG